VVLDEIVAVPLCFVPVLLAQTQSLGHFPDLATFVRTAPPWIIPAGFAAFRLFDIWKPFPIRQLQHLPRGWGIVADDLLAAIWVALLSLLLIG
jgi:phosphatidylglycerophosphatase A